MELYVILKKTYDNNGEDNIIEACEAEVDPLAYTTEKKAIKGRAKLMKLDLAEFEEIWPQEDFDYDISEFVDTQNHETYIDIYDSETKETLYQSVYTIERINYNGKNNH